MISTYIKSNNSRSGGGDFLGGPGIFTPPREGGARIFCTHIGGGSGMFSQNVSKTMFFLHFRRPGMFSENVSKTMFFLHFRGFYWEVP